MSRENSLQPGTAHTPPPPAYPQTGQTGAALPPYGPAVPCPGAEAGQVQPLPRRETTAVDRWLLLAAVLVGIGYDRLVVRSISISGWHMPFFSAIFWLLYLVVYYKVNWAKLKKNKLMWMVGGFAAALCIWNFLFDYRSNFGSVTFFVIPGVLMAHAQFSAGEYKLKQVAAIVAAWLQGWFVRPFSAVPVFFSSLGSLSTSGKNPVLKKVLVGLAVSLPLLAVILPLLSGADMVFGYYLKNLFRNFNLPSLIGHSLVVFVAATLFYSFLWNTRFGKKLEHVKGPQLNMDLVVVSVVLSVVVLIYLLFCAVQFTYLFARAGLPGNMTYSEYAREGFAQLIAVASINLILFGMFLQYTKRNKGLTVLLACLLGTTGLMLVSSFARLGLYIDAYGLTWLRILSAWFILYLAAVLVLCALRMVRESLPVVAICALILIGWYTALGYANPDAMVVRYNAAKAGQTKAEWYATNSNTVDLWDDAVLAADGSVDKGSWRDHGRGYSLASYRVRQRLNEQSNQ